MACIPTCIFIYLLIFHQCLKLNLKKSHSENLLCFSDKIQLDLCITELGQLKTNSSS